MNKFLRKAIVLAITGSMIAGTAATVSAADTSTGSGLNAGETVNADTASINLIKNYTLGTANYDKAESPKETFEFTIEPYGVWNAGSSTGQVGGEAYSITNMPALAEASNDNANTNSKYTVKVESKSGSSSVDNVNKVTIHTEKNYANNNNSTTSEAILTLNDFKSVGDFWYKVTETNNNTTGVIYGTNDNNSVENLTSTNNGHNATYYIHVQVINNPNYNVNGNTKKFLRSVTMHKAAPVNTNAQPFTTNKDYNNWSRTDSNYKNTVKVKNIQNTYYAGSLSIKKEVTGNAGDKEKRFEVTVVFTKPQGTVITSDITYSAATSATATKQIEQTINGQNSTDATKNKWMTIGSNSTETTISTDSDAEASATAKIYIKDGETVTFNNIPYGVTYKVYETEPTDDNYTNKLVFTKKGDTTVTSFNGTSLTEDTDKKETTTDGLGSFFGEKDAATGSISDASDEITITNHKESTIDVGVITSNAPYIAMLILAAAAAFVFIRRRRDLIEE